MARVIHIAVNLSLVVALTMQPAFAYVVEQDCSADCTSGFMCQDCGCCKVRSETAKCPCCSEKPLDDKERSDCCEHGFRVKLPQPVLTVDEDDPFAGMVLEEGPVLELREERHPSEKEGQLTVKAAVPTLSSRCHCVTTSEPYEAPVPRSPVTELRDIMLLSVVLFAVPDSTGKPPLASSIDAEQPTFATHFSQISFCVWRL